MGDVISSGMRDKSRIGRLSMLASIDALTDDVRLGTLEGVRTAE